jgi:hypothetical protein
LVVSLVRTDGKEEGDGVAHNSADSVDLFQIAIVDGGQIPDPLPPRIADNIASLKAVYPRANHHLLGDAELRRFIGGHFAAGVLEAYDTLTPYAFKADLARYCLLFAKGGLYADLGVRFINPMPVPPGAGIGCFRDLTGSSNTSWAVSNTIIYAAPERLELKLAIDLVVANCGERHYGANALCPTGPVLFGRALAMAYRAEDCFVGELRRLTPDLANPNVGYVAPDGTIVGLRARQAEAIPYVASLGLAGTNNYADLWHSRLVYGEGRMSWSHLSPAIHCHAERTPQGIRIDRGVTGIRIFGPYTALQPGSYRAVVRFAPGPVTGTPHLDVCSDFGTVILADSDVAVDAHGEAAIAFTVGGAHQNIEIRVHSTGDFAGLYLGTELAKNDLTALHPIAKSGE